MAKKTGTKMPKKPKREESQPIPPPPQQPPIFVMFEDPNDRTIRFDSSEGDIVRAHRAAQRLFDDGVIRVILVRGVQEIIRPDR